MCDCATCLMRCNDGDEVQNTISYQISVICSSVRSFVALCARTETDGRMDGRTDGPGRTCDGMSQNARTNTYCTSSPLLHLMRHVSCGTHRQSDRHESRPTTCSVLKRKVEGRSQISTSARQTVSTPLQCKSNQQEPNTLGVARLTRGSSVFNDTNLTDKAALSHEQCDARAAHARLCLAAPSTCEHHILLNRKDRHCDG